MLSRRSLDPNGEAAKSGARAKDRIIKINLGSNNVVDVANDKSKIESILSSAPGSVELVVERTAETPRSSKAAACDIFADAPPKRPASGGLFSNRSTSSTRSSPRDIANQFAGVGPQSGQVVQCL